MGDSPAEDQDGVDVNEKPKEEGDAKPSPNGKSSPKGGKGGTDDGKKMVYREKNSGKDQQQKVWVKKADK